jgi:RimJ/RimL family protein N-acetyltransferase
MNDFFTGEIVLENERSRLEPLAQVHFHSLWPVAQQEEIWQFTSAKINAEEDFKKYFQQALEERANGASYPFAIFDKQENKWAGSTRFGNISFEHKRLEIGWTWYHPELQRTGLNRACKFLLLSYAFEELGFKRIELKTSSLNEKSRTAIAGIGATQEGILRKHMINEDGSQRDSVLFSIIDDEWAAIKQRVFASFL